MCSRELPPLGAPPPVSLRLPLEKPASGPHSPVSRSCSIPQSWLFEGALCSIIHCGHSKDPAVSPAVSAALASACGNRHLIWNSLGRMRKSARAGRLAQTHPKESSQRGPGAWPVNWHSGHLRLTGMAPRGLSQCLWGIQVPLQPWVGLGYRQKTLPNNRTEFTLFLCESPQHVQRHASPAG